MIDGARKTGTRLFLRRERRKHAQIVEFASKWSDRFAPPY
jgi:hypothetical protein